MRVCVCVCVCVCLRVARSLICCSATAYLAELTLNNGSHVDVVVKQALPSGENAYGLSAREMAHVFHDEAQVGRARSSRLRARAAADGDAARGRCWSHCSIATSFASTAAALRRIRRKTLSRRCCSGTTLFTKRRSAGSSG